MSTKKKLTNLASALGVLTKKSVLTFGKYSTRTVKQVLKDDPEYLCWIHDNTSHKLHSSVITEAREKASIVRLKKAPGRRSYDAYGDDLCYNEWEEFVDCGPFW